RTMSHDDLSRTVLELIPRQIDHVSGDGDLRMMGNPFGWDALSLTETAIYARQSVEDADRWRHVDRVLNQRGPRNVNLAAGVESESRSILRASLDLPLVFADENWRDERPATVARFSERHVTDVLWVDVTPREVDVALGASNDRRFAAMADAACDGMA